MPVIVKKNKSFKEDSTKSDTPSFLKGKPGAGKPKSGPVEVSLPSKPTTPSNDIRDFSILIHGEKKGGKTSMLSQEEGAFFLEFDPLQKGLAIYQRHVNTWPELLAYIKILEEESTKKDCRFRTVVVDRVDIMYDKCFNYVCKKLVIDHPNDEKDFGKSWKAISDEFKDAVLRLMSLRNIAARFICHSQWKETKDRDGNEIDKLLPSLTSGADKALSGDVDIFACLTFIGKGRYLIISGEETVGCGQRVASHFLTPDGRKVQEIYLGTDEKQSYANFLAAFNNKQTYTTHAERLEQKKSKVKTKTK